jgi:hypothetical protein
MARAATAALLAGALLIGLAQVALLPPWEGFDETAHYSYIQQLADTGTWPRLGERSSAELDAYVGVAPTASSVPGALSYRDFFGSAPHKIEAGRAAVHSTRDAAGWRPGAGVNWQAQHPPLYYLLMTPLYRLSKGWSLGSQLLLMRGASYCFAWLALCLATVSMLAQRRAAPSLPAELILAPALWPLLFPMWFPEMARLGSDSLVCLLAACAWIVALRLAVSNAGAAWHLALGALLGLGLLTKATFLPFVAAMLGWLAWRVWQGRACALVLRRRLCGLGMCSAIATVIAGWWYLYKLLETGSSIGSDNVVHLYQAGGMLAGLLQHGSLNTFARLPWLFVSTFVWAGTWSFVRPPLLSLVPLALTTVLVGIGYLRSLEGRTPTLLDGVPGATAALFILALLYHSLILIALGSPGAPAWYLHSFAPVLAPLLGYGLAGAGTSRPLRGPMRMLLGYPVVFLPIAFGIQALFFAGCGGPSAPGSSFYYLPSAASCATSPWAIVDNLAVLGFPRAAAVLFAGGWVLANGGLVAALWCMRDQLREGHRPRARHRLGHCGSKYQSRDGSGIP